MSVAHSARNSRRVLKERLDLGYEQLRLMSFDGSREWDFAKEDTQYSTHGLHTYLAAMNPPLARRLIQMYVPKNGSLLDPFCGGGAVLVEAALNKRDAAGSDVNELALLISGAKTTYVPQMDVLAVGKKILDAAKSFEGESLEFAKSDYIHYWFKPSTMRPLTGLRLAIDKIPDQLMRRLFQVIFSGTVRDVSLTHRNEIRLRRFSEEEQARFNPNVFERFGWRVRDAALRVSQFPCDAKTDVARGSVMGLSFRDGEFTSIVCSPPYGDERNGIPYVQFAKNMLLWLGYSSSGIRESKQDTLGWGKNGKIAPPSRELERLLEIIQNNAVAVKEAIAFYADLYVALREMARVVKERVIIVIGQRVLSSTIFDNALITTELMTNLGMQLECLHSRRLPTKRLPRLREYGGAIDQEIILIFHK